MREAKRNVNQTKTVQSRAHLKSKVNERTNMLAKIRSTPFLLSTLSQSSKIESRNRISFSPLIGKRCSQRWMKENRSPLDVLDLKPPSAFSMTGITFNVDVFIAVWKTIGQLAVVALLFHFLKKMERIPADTGPVLSKVFFENDCPFSIFHRWHMNWSFPL